AARWHLEDVGSARCVEHVRPLEETRERLAVLAVADEAEAGVRHNFARDTAHATAPTAKREVIAVQTHVRRSRIHRSANRHHPVDACACGAAGFPSQWLRNAASQALPAGS